MADNKVKCLFSNKTPSIPRDLTPSYLAFLYQANLVQLFSKLVLVESAYCSRAQVDRLRIPVGQFDQRWRRTVHARVHQDQSKARGASSLDRRNSDCSIGECCRCRLLIHAGQVLKVISICSWPSLNTWTRRGRMGQDFCQRSPPIEPRLEP